MPNEVVHWGHQYTVKHHPETENVGGWDEEIPFKGYPEGTVPPTVHRTPKLSVHWSRPEDFGAVAYDEDPEGHVQIGMDISAREIELAAKSVKDGSSFHGFFTDSLSRYQINHLIKILKRARDSAKGADE